MAASFVHLQVSKEALKQVFSASGHNRYRKVIDNFLHFVLLGSVSPDYPYLANKITGTNKTISWGDKLHNFRTSDNVRIGLKLLAGEADKGSDSFLMKLAWLMGYYSHVMTDVVVHPVIYKLVGPYLGDPSGHAKYELYQDSIMCHLLTGKEIDSNEYLKPLTDCGSVSEFTLDLNPTQIVIKDPIPEFWKSILKENYPDAYSNDEPNINAWHRVFLQLLSIAREGKYIFGKLPFESPILYDRFEDIPSGEKDKGFFKLILPDGNEGNYRNDVFDKAVKIVAAGWDNLLNGLGDSNALSAFNDSLKNWNLDNGTPDGINFALWAGKTTDWTGIA